MDVGRRHPDANHKGGINIAGENDSGMIQAFLATIGKKILKG